MDIEALRTLIVPDIGASLDVPHPASLGKVDEVIYTAWMDSSDPRDIDGNINCVKGRIIELGYIDEFGEPIGRSEYVLQHQYDHPTRRGTNSISATPLKPRTMHGERGENGTYSTLPLRKRFPAAFDQFERKLRGAEKPFPLALLDNVPPEVLETLLALGVDTVQGFAEADDTFLGRLKSRLEADKYVQRAQNVATYLERAREFVGYSSDEPKSPRKRAA